MSAIDRAKQPESGTLRAFDFPSVERRRLPNGLDLRVARMSRLPIVSVKLFMRGGESGLAPERAGLCVLTADALDGGTKKRSGAELADALERIGARLHASAAWEGTSVGLSCLADRLPEALRLLAEAVREPAFAQDEVDRALQQHLAGIRQRAADPSALATDSARARYFAADVPYSRPVDGTTSSMAGLERAALVGYAEAAYRPAAGALIVAGDVDTGEVEEMAHVCFDGWGGTPAVNADFTVGPATTRRSVHIVDRPGSVQTDIRVGHVGVARDTPDYFPLSVANMILGGMFTSRLNLNLRERHGFTYGVRSRFGYRTRPGPFEVSTSVGNEVTAGAVREIVYELGRMAEGGPTEAEVVAARDYAAGIFGLRLETAGEVAMRLAQLVIYGLPDGYFDGYRDAVRSVGVDAAAAASRAHIRPDELQIVLVGDAEAIAPSVAELELGPLEVADAP